MRGSCVELSAEMRGAKPDVSVATRREQMGDDLLRIREIFEGSQGHRI